MIQIVNGNRTATPRWMPTAPVQIREVFADFDFSDSWDDNLRLAAKPGFSDWDLQFAAHANGNSYPREIEVHSWEMIHLEIVEECQPEAQVQVRR